jgi:hypothetical protein
LCEPNKHGPPKWSIETKSATSSWAWSRNCSTGLIRSSLDTFLEIERVHKLSLCHHSHVVLLFCAKEGGSEKRDSRRRERDCTREEKEGGASGVVRKFPGRLCVLSVTSLRGDQMTPSKIHTSAALTPSSSSTSPAQRKSRIGRLFLPMLDFRAFRRSHGGIE